VCTDVSVSVLFMGLIILSCAIESAFLYTCIQFLMSMYLIMNVLILSVILCNFECFNDVIYPCNSALCCELV
jgi:hypothetical protein